MKKLQNDTNRQVKARLTTIGESKRIEALLGVCDASLTLSLHSPRESRRMSMFAPHIQANAGQCERGLLLSPDDHVDVMLSMPKASPVGPLVLREDNTKRRVVTDARQENIDNLKRILIDEFDGDIEHTLKSMKCEDKFVGWYATLPAVVVESPTWKERTTALLERIEDLPGDQLVTLEELSTDRRLKSATFTVEFVKNMIDKQD